MGGSQRFEREKIRELREALDMSPEQFAEHICGAMKAQGEKDAVVTGRSIRRWEDGAVVPNARGLEYISRAFGVPVSRFFVDTK
jgi:transcriptional regulator with XRE-family HTH domain